MLEQEDGSLRAKWQVCHKALLEEQSLLRELERESNAQDQPAAAPPLEDTSTSNRTPVDDASARKG